MPEISQKQLEANRENARKGGVKTDKSKAVAKKVTGIEARDLIRKNLSVDCDPDHIFKIAAEKIEICRNGNKTEAGKAEKELVELFKESVVPLALEKHYALAETVGERYRPLLIETTRQIEKEYDCKTPSEMMLAESIAGAYIRIINNSRKLDALTNEGYLTSERNGYGNMLSKEIDRAQRHLTNSLMVLKQIRTPSIEINVKAKTAFVSQNQQINAVNKPIQQDENIEPK